MPALKREPEIFPENLFQNGFGGGTWWVAHVRSRQEKSLARHLHQQEVRYYLPQREQRARRRGKIRSSFLPLFTGYLFFQGDVSDRVAALKSNLVVSVLDVFDPRLLHEELRNLWRLQTTGALLVPHPYLGPGDRIEVVDGPFRGYRGTVVREKGCCRLVVSISLLRQSVAAELGRDAVVPARHEAVRMTA